MLSRILEPEVMDTTNEALTYDAMDHEEVNRAFAADLLTCLPAAAAPAEPPDTPRWLNLLDLGTGTARIPILLCQLRADLRIWATDLSAAMLAVARNNIELDQPDDRVRLDRADAKQLDYNDGMFDAVFSNSLVHHLPAPGAMFGEVLRVTRAGGRIFVRDLARPASAARVQELVGQYAADESPQGQQLLAASLHAALTLEEVRQLVQQEGGDPEAVTLTSDRHWTWSQAVPD